MNILLLFFILFQIYFCIKLYKKKKYNFLTIYILFSFLFYYLVYENNKKFYIHKFLFKNGLIEFNNSYRS